MTAPVILAQHPTRAILQPSVHARGARNYVYVGGMDDYHAPGALHARGETRCAVDAAWLVQGVLGLPRHAPSVWPGVPGARERAIAYGAQVGLYEYQQEGAAFLAERDYALLADQMGCIEGDAVIRANRAGRGFPIPLVQLFRRFNGLHGTWDPAIPTRIRVNALGSLRLHTVRAVLHKGVRDVVRLSLKSGKTLRLTPDHEVGVTNDSYTAVADLRPGDRVLSNGAAVCARCGGSDRVVVGTRKKFAGFCRKCIYRHLRSNPNAKDGRWKDKDGYIRVSGHLDHPRCTTGGVYEHILVKEAEIDRFITANEEVHHRNRIKDDNRPENLELLEGGEHHAQHGREGGFRSLNGGRTINGGVVEFVPVEDEVVSVEPAGQTDVYDIVCDDPYRNFVANGIVVHNCGKTPEAIVAAEARLSLGYIPTPDTPVVLVLSPALAKYHWQEQITRWTGHSSTILEGMTAGDLPQTRYVIANYDILHGARRKDAAGVVHDIAHLTGWAKTLASQFLIVICDEAHVLRGRVSQRNKFTKEVCKKVPVVWGLSGTPIPNYVRDLWAVWDVLSDGLAGGYWNWAKAYADGQQGQYGWRDTGSSRVQELSSRLTFFCLGRSAEQVKLQLPEKRREVYKVDVTVSAMTVSEGNDALLRKTFVAKALRATAKAKRSAVIEQAVEALTSHQKVIVFVYMREQADAVAKGIKAKFDGQVACVHGDMTPEGRSIQAQVFREAVGAACFVATIDSVTMAISLVGAHLVLFGDLVPEPWKLLQAEKRAHRIGGTTRVLVRYLIGIGTLDEAVAESVIAKLAVIEQALGGEADQGELQTMLGGRTDESIVDGLFERLQALSGSGNE